MSTNKITVTENAPYYVGDGRVRNAAGEEVAWSKQIRKEMEHEPSNKSLRVNDDDYFEQVDILAQVSNEQPSQVLDDVYQWYSRFIVTHSENDLYLLTLFTVHTHLLAYIPVSPRLIIDSIVAGSGKTTVLEHMEKLCFNAQMGTAFGSAALIPRMIEAAGEDSLTLLIDEADRTLDPKKEGVGDLVACINAGYKPSGKRKVLVPEKRNGWKPADMSAYCAIVMAGNNTFYADDTLQRSHRIFLIPDREGKAEETDWVSDDTLVKEAKALQERIKAWASLMSARIKETSPVLPDGCKNRVRERWIAFAKIAQLAGGGWPYCVRDMIESDVRVTQEQFEAGIQNLPRSSKLIRDLVKVFNNIPVLSTTALLNGLKRENPEEWGSKYKFDPLTRQALNKMLSRMGVYSSRVTWQGKRTHAYRLADVQALYNQLHLDEVENLSD